MWDIMLCSWSRVLARFVTFIGPSWSCSRMASRVGFARVEKNP